MLSIAKDSTYKTPIEIYSTRRHEWLYEKVSASYCMHGVDSVEFNEACDKLNSYENQFPGHQLEIK